MHIISLFLSFLIHFVYSIPTSFQPIIYDKEIITSALTSRDGRDGPFLSDWTSQQDKVVWSNSLPPQNNDIPAVAADIGIFLGVTNPAPSSTENDGFDFVIPVTPDAPTPEQEQQQEQQPQQPAKLPKGENGCPTTFPSAVCDPGEGVTQITKAALPGFLNLDKCRLNSPLMDPCRLPERLWCCADAKTQDSVGIYGRSTRSHLIQTEYNYQGLTCQLAINLPVA